MAKQIALGKKVAAIAGKNKAFGRAIDKLPHKSDARTKMASRKKAKK